MELIIGNLVNRFERGALSRRDLIRGLALLAATTGASAAAAQDQPAPVAAVGTATGVQATTLDHFGLQVTDLERSVDFYTKMFGLTVQSRDQAKQIARVGVGKKTFISLNKNDTGGRVDHVAFAMDNFNEAAVSQHLKDIGANPSRDATAGFHVTDPDGFPIQLV